jgi:hypothetical protein
MLILITWDQAGPLDEKWRPLVRKVGEWYVASWHLQGCSSCLCRLRTDELVPMSKYWMYWSHAGDMGLVSLVAYSSTDVWLKRTASMVVLGEKLRWVPQATQPGWEVESGAPFLGSSESIQLCWVSVKGCHVRWPCCRKHMHGLCGLALEAYVSCWSDFPLQSVHQFESPWLSDMSNYLSHGSLHVVN